MKDITESIKKELIEIRRSLHKNPELGFSEFKTAGLVADYLESLGIETKRGVAKTGVTGLIKGRDKGKTLLLRADMDALPMLECTDAEYKSQNEGVMHACGHDVHTAILMGVANVMSSISDSFDGNIKLVFQPAEEAMGGAQPMINEGIMENPKVDAAAAFHIWDLPAGTIGIKSGGVTASPDHFHVKITGKGGHGASPERCINPIEIGSRIATRLNAIRFEEPSLVTICSFLSGTGENIIPDTALLKGTARAIDEKTRQRVYEEILLICHDTAKSLGGTATVEYRFLYPPATNDEALTNIFIDSASQVIGSENVIIQQKPDMIGDDFSYFSELVPSCYVKLGGALAPLHTSCFDVDENCIATGVNIMCKFALDYLK